jgi:transposase
MCLNGAVKPIEGKERNEKKLNSFPSASAEGARRTHKPYCVLRSGCPWRLLPHDLPAWGIVYSYFRIWRDEGI